MERSRMKGKEGGEGEEEGCTYSSCNELLWRLRRFIK